MIRCYFGAGLLTALLILCLGSTGIFNRRQEEILVWAEQAFRAAEAGDWEQARDKAEQARERWDRGHRLSAVLTDHSALETVDTAFVQVRDSREPADYRQLFEALESLIDEHRISLETIF